MMTDNYMMDMSGSQLEAFLRCGHQWALRKNPQLRGPENTKLIRGRVFHSVVQGDALQFIEHGRWVAPLEDLHDQAEQYLINDWNATLNGPGIVFAEPKKTKSGEILDDMAHCLADIRTCLTWYYNEIRPRPDYRPIMVEQQVKMEFKQGEDPDVLLFSGRPDIVCEGGFWDWKVTQKRTNIQTHLQIIMYHIMLSDYLQKPVPAFLCQINPTKGEGDIQGPWVPSQKTVERALMILSRVYQQIKTGLYPIAAQDAALSWVCGACDVRKHCQYTLQWEEIKEESND